MEPSTSELVRIHRGLVALAVAASVVAFGALGWVVTGFVSPALGYAAATPPPWSICTSASLADLGALGASLSPPDGATVQAGAPVTFSGHSEAPVTFAVASSAAPLSSPDIDSGLGSAQPESPSPGPPPSYTYTFTSTRATATPGTIYWDSSFSNATLAECAGLTPTTYTTTVRALTVLPAPTSPPPTPESPPSPLGPPPVHVSIGALSGFHPAHPTVVYRIHCTASCSGDTYYQALVLRRHGKAVRAPKLDLSPEPVSIITAAGGDAQVTHRYSGGSLRMLKSILRAGSVVKLRISVKVTDASGDVVLAHRTARL